MNHSLGAPGLKRATEKQKRSGSCREAGRWGAGSKSRKGGRQAGRAHAPRAPTAPHAIPAPGLGSGAGTGSVSHADSLPALKGNQFSLKPLVRAIPA